jgi:hypothetical protein
MAGATSPDLHYELYQHEISLLVSAWRSMQPTLDPANEQFYGWAPDDFRAQLRLLRDEIEQRAYLAIVAATEGTLQSDFRARARGRSRVPLRDSARELCKREARGKRVDLEEILEIWRSEPGFAISRARALFVELRRIDPEFPRG